MIFYEKLKSTFYMPFSFFLFFVELSFCQVKVGDWNSLTSFLRIRDVQFIENTLYSATEGGILSIKENDYSVITNTNGLIGVDLLSIAKIIIIIYGLEETLLSGSFNYMTLY